MTQVTNFFLRDFSDEEGRVTKVCVLRSMRLVPRDDREPVVRGRFEGKRVRMMVNRRSLLVDERVEDLLDEPYVFAAQLSVFPGFLTEIHFDDPYAAGAYEIQFTGFNPTEEELRRWHERRRRA